MALIESINQFDLVTSLSLSLLTANNIKVLPVSDALFICALSFESGTNQLHASQQQTFTSRTLSRLFEDEEFSGFDSRVGAQRRS
jgi:succinylarginine dihydrolase